MQQEPRYVLVSEGMPELSRDVSRNLDRGMKALEADGREASVTIRAGHAAMRPHLDEVMMAYRDRNVQVVPPRPVLPQDFRDTFAAATELAMLRIDDRLASWALTRRAGGTCEFLAAQMAPGFERYRPGRMLEAFLLARAVLDPGCQLLDWGEGHPEALLTA